MAGTLTLSTLSDGTNSTSATNAIRGSARAWAVFTGGNGNTAGTVVNSFNISSITVNGSGDFTVNFTTAMPNANYSFFGSALENINNTAEATNRLITPIRTPFLTTSVRVACTYNVNAQRDVCYWAFVTIFGN
jgi:hypothetical protein